jgi:uncharacterized glyoxalase superfamily protein PhnB
MKPSPAGWPRISSALFYQDAARAIDWIRNAFGFEIRIKVDGEGGKIAHAELVFGDGLIMIGSVDPGRPGAETRRSPRDIGGGNTQGLLVYVDDADAHCERARLAGARIVSEPKTVDHGEGYWADRICEIEDIEGHRWWFAHRVRG